MRLLNPSRLFLFACAILAATAAAAGNLGPDDRQVTATGPAGSTETDAFAPAVAFDPGSQRYLLVWSADPVDGEFRIFGRMLSGSSGANVGPEFTISPAGSPETDDRQPTVAFSPEHGHFLVVWTSDLLNDGAEEIHGRLVDAEGNLVGPARRYSDMGSDDLDPAFDAVTPDLAWHPFLDAFVLTWAADDDAGDLLDGRFEIYGQLIDGATGDETGGNDFRITFSLSGPVQNDVIEPTVAVHPSSDRWFVAFEGDVVSDAVHDPEIWMYGCTADVPDPSAVNVGIMGANYGDGLSGRNPDLAWVPSSGELVCVWDGDDDSGKSPAVYGQRMNLDGSPIGARLELSAGAGTVYGDLREAAYPSITIDPVSDEWFVVWRGDLDDGLTQFDHELWARRFDDNGGPVDAAAFRLSDMDPVLGAAGGAGPPAVAVNGVHGYKLIAWSGDPASTPAGENEIFVQGWADDDASATEEAPPAAFVLHGAAPNPFNPSTVIAFDLPRAAPVSLRVFDAAGRLVRTLLRDDAGKLGRNEVSWNGRDDAGRQAASGVYLYRLESDGFNATDRMVLIK